MPPTVPRLESSVPDVIADIAAKGDFPAVGAVIQRLRELVGREQCTTLDIARLILQDPGLSSKVLRLVNSAFYRQRGNPVSTVTRAVILLGFGAIRDLTTGLLLVEELARKGRASDFVRGGVRQALLTAIVSQSLAVKIGLPTPEEAYLLGLFANLGSLWLATFYPGEFDEALTLAQTRKAPLERTMTQVFGVTSGVLASAILEHWNFPARYGDYFRHPHPRDRHTVASGSEKLMAVVELAAEYAAAAGDDATPSDAVLARFHTMFGLPHAHFYTVARAAEDTLRDQASILGLASARPGPGRPADAARPPTPAATPLEPPSGDTVAALALLAEISRSLLEADDPDHTLSMILEGIGRIGRFDVVLLVLVTDGGAALVSRLAYGQRAQDVRSGLIVPLRADGGLLAATVLAAAPQTVPGGTAALLVPEGTPAPPVPDGAFVTHPILARGRVAGAVLAARSGGPAGATDVPLLEVLCTQASLALERLAH